MFGLSSEDGGKQVWMAHVTRFRVGDQSHQGDQH